MQNLWFVHLFNELFTSTYRKPKCINIFLRCGLPAHTSPQCSFFVWTLLPLILSRYYIELIVSHPSWIVTNLKLYVADAPLLAFVVEFWPRGDFPAAQTQHSFDFLNLSFKGHFVFVDVMVKESIQITF